jgi:hypothetical protein
LQRREETAESAGLRPAATEVVAAAVAAAVVVRSSSSTKNCSALLRVRIGSTLPEVLEEMVATGQAQVSEETEATVALADRSTCSAHEPGSSHTFLDLLAAQAERR